MPPENVDTATLAPQTAVPPTKMPLPPAAMAPELLMPPVKVDTLIETPFSAKPPTEMPM